MPVKKAKKRVFGGCDCCGSQTVKVTGTVFLNDGSETSYLARWTVAQPKHGMAFLILIANQGVFVSVVYSFELGSFMVVGPEGQNWYLDEDSLRILEREEVIGTPLAEYVFKLIDEIWIHDRYVRKFHRKFDD